MLYSILESRPIDGILASLRHSRFAEVGDGPSPVSISKPLHRLYESKEDVMRKRLLFLTLVAVVLLALLPATAGASGCTPSYYRVQRGDTLFMIATRHGASMYAIANASGITNLNVIYVGQLLVIPCGTPPAPAPPPRPPVSCIHIVQRGEWLSTIARRYGVSMWAMARANGLSNPNWIYPGQRLVVPGCRPYVPPPPPTPPPPPPPPTCSVMPVLGFGRVWMTRPIVRNRLGCAQSAEFSVAGAAQQFDHGVAVWRDDQAEVTALYNNGTWAMLPGPLVPYLGWPATARWEFQVSVQNFAGGHMLWTPSFGIYVLYNDGTWKHYD